MTEQPAPSRARTVAAGILSSRITGLVREMAVAAFLGVGAYADVLHAAFKAPNVLQNLLGEGTLSAAFIPTYSQFLKEGREEEAGRLAGAVFTLLLVVVAGLVLAGTLLARPIVSLLYVGWVGDAAEVAAGALAVDRLELTIRAFRLILPMAGILVLSAWALGVLNSHRRFFVPYFAPVLWNAAIIAGLFLGARLAGGASVDGIASGAEQILFAAFMGALIGGALQLFVQLPVVFRVMRGFRLSLSRRVAGVKRCIAAFWPAVAGRGVAQVSSYADQLLASFLAAGAMSALRPALVLYLLPISLFGLSVAAAELPELSRLATGDRAQFLARARRSIRQSMFLAVPTAVGFLCLGYLLVGAVFRRAAFGHEAQVLVWVVLCAYSLGLVATTMSRLLQNTFWALGDTKSPAKIAGLRLLLSVSVAAPLMLWLDQWEVAQVAGLAPDALQSALRFGAVGLGIGSTLAAWVELTLLRGALRSHEVQLQLPWKRLVTMLGLSGVAAAVSLAIWWVLPAWPLLVRAVLVVGTYAGLYLGLARFLGLPELRLWTGRLRRR